MRQSSPISVYSFVTLWGLLLTLVDLGGCSELGVMLGMRTRLDKLPVTSISSSMVGKAGPITALAPGGSARLVVVATTQDGKQLVTAGAGKGNVLLDSFVFTANLAQVDKRGKVSLPADPRITDGKVPIIHIAAVGHPDVVADLDIGVRYDVPFVANLSGTDGANGIDGFNGLDGSSGTNAMSAPPDPITGMPGPQGAGGSGGSGGQAGRGGAGGLGNPNGFAGTDGFAGSDGRRGNGGAAGTIAVSVDPAAQPFQGILSLSNHSGSGQKGPAPALVIEPVLPLW